VEYYTAGIGKFVPHYTPDRVKIVLHNVNNVNKYPHSSQERATKILTTPL